MPPGFVPDRRYPLVVQTHGFNPSEFLIDGPNGITSAMAAQALANAGIVVLQIGDNPAAKTLDAREPELYAAGYRAGIRELVRRGIADPTRVGLTAFSRTGLPAIRLLAQQPNVLATATIADAGWFGYLNDLLLTNTTFGENIQAVTGGQADPRSLAAWIARNPLYRLAHNNIPIRIESYGNGGPMSALSHWELFSILRRSGRGVDFVYFPYGGHLLRKPAEILASQQGIVDWYRFWLQGYEDPDPAKSEQYSRWRELRRQRDTALAQPRPPRLDWSAGPVLTDQQRTPK